MSRDDGDDGDSKTRDYPIFCCKGFLRVSAVRFWFRPTRSTLS
jgi:hypothetical protein